MAINIDKYVAISSGSAAPAGVASRELIGRVFVDLPFVPPGEVFEFTSAEEVRQFVNGRDGQFLQPIADAYFGFTSKTFSRPRRISVARYSLTGSSPEVHGAAPAPLDALTSIEAGTFEAVLEGQDPLLVGPLDFSGAATLADVITTLRTALANAVGTAGYPWVSSSVDMTPSGGLLIQLQVSSGVEGAFSITDGDEQAATLLGIVSGVPGVETFPAVAGAPVAEWLSEAEQISDNFGSFVIAGPLSPSELVEAAEWTHSHGVKYMFSAPAGGSQQDVEDLADALSGYTGCAVTHCPNPFASTDPADIPGALACVLPMAIMAATDYSRRNASQNYMFQQMAGVPSTVRTTQESDALDAKSVNYYGETKTAGQTITFYQRGVLMGTPTVPRDMNTYANEVWLQDRARAACMSLLLSVNRVPANQEGRGQVLAILQEAVNQALFNGVISVGKTLTAAQRAQISELSGDPDAWHQVQNAGFWLDAAVVPYDTTDGRTEYKIVYLLIYAKDDAVRKVEGTHALV